MATIPAKKGVSLRSPVNAGRLFAILTTHSLNPRAISVKYPFVANQTGFRDSVYLA